MKATGVTRKIDELGRIVLPIDVRRKLNLSSGDSMEFFVDEGRIILKKYKPSCAFCSGVDGLVFYKGRLVCRDCVNALNELL